MDGSCYNKTKSKGGAGVVILTGKGRGERHSFGQYRKCTSAQMEIKAVLEALKLVTDKSSVVTIYCDNQYVVNSIAKGWVFKWEAENWVSRSNSELWKQVLQELSLFKHYVTILWIRGHNGNKWNEVADRLANQGAKCETIINL